MSLFPSTYWPSIIFSIIMRRLERDRPSAKPVDKFSSKEVLRSIGSPHVIIFCIISFSHVTLTHGLNLYLPSIVYQLGFSRNATQLLSAGPFAAGFCGKYFVFKSVRAHCAIPFKVTLLLAFLSDRYKLRGIMAIPVCILAIAGFVLYLCKNGFSLSINIFVP